MISTSSARPMRVGSLPLLRALLVVLVVLQAGCAERWWRVYRQVSPNPMLHRHDFVLAPFLFDGINIEGRSEPEFMTGPPEMVASYLDGKARLVNTFAARMAQSRYHVTVMEGDVAPSGVFVIRPHATYIRFLHRPVGHGSISQMTGSVLVQVQIFTRDGTLLDDVRITAPENGGERERNLGGQMEYMGGELAHLLTEYLETRTEE